MGLLDGTLQQKIQRVEKLTSPNQYPKPSQDSIDKLRNNIRGLAKATPSNTKKKGKRIKKSDLKKRYA